MNFRMASSLLLTAFLTLSAHAADPLVSASEPATVIAALNSSGLPSQLAKNNAGDPYITFKSDEGSYTLYFMNCVNHVKCTAIAFATRWANTKTVTLAQINAKWAQPYTSPLAIFLDSEGAMAGQSMLYTEPGGVGKAVFIANIRSLINSAHNAYDHIVNGK